MNKTNLELAVVAICSDPLNTAGMNLDEILKLANERVKHNEQGISEIVKKTIERERRVKGDKEIVKTVCTSINRQTRVLIVNQFLGKGDLFYSDIERLRIKIKVVIQSATETQEEVRETMMIRVVDAGETIISDIVDNVEKNHKKQGVALKNWKDIYDLASPYLLTGMNFGQAMKQLNLFLGEPDVG